MNLRQERVKKLYEHKLSVRRILLEKLLLAFALALFGTLAHYGVENYRSKLTESRFLLEQRYGEIVALRKAYAELVSTHTDFASSATASLEDYRASIDRLLSQTNNSLLLSPAFSAQLQYHLWTHQAVAKLGAGNSGEYRGLVTELAEEFNDMCRSELQSVPPQYRIDFGNLSDTEIEARGAAYFLQDALDRWRDRGAEENK